MAAGISPNFVHSLDASHLMMTVATCLEYSDIQHFAMIHDSYGTHAANTDTLAELLREAFVAQYGQEVIREFYEELCEQVPEGVELPPPPAVGDFDLEQVLDAPYFFA
ncbi:DNA-directed RNA polymerase [Paludibacterium sp. B53371]|uniref:DNA-directed RNA polymerase n=1 Tax=Paludibacterium sp. B53371 TaxID=2806263 RepID=UPI001C04C6D4